MNRARGYRSYKFELATILKAFLHLKKVHDEPRPQSTNTGAEGP